MIIIDSGHGGNDPGSSNKDIIEKNYVLDISKYMHDRLEQLNIPSTLTRNIDETLIPTDRIKRIKDIGDDKNNILISNHLNTERSNTVKIIYALRSKNVLANLILNEMTKEKQNVRSPIQKRLTTDLSKDYYYIMRDTVNLEPIIIEYDFITNKNQWTNMAEATIRALANYLNVPYTSPFKSEEIIEEVNDNNTYTVLLGDSIFSIAKKFNIKVEDIKNLNNLKSNTLEIGQKILIDNL